MDNFEFSWQTKPDLDNGDPVLWIRIDGHDDVVFRFANLQWGEEGEDGNVPLSYNVIFETEEAETRSFTIKLFQDKCDAIMQALLQMAEQRAQEIMQQSQVQPGIDEPVAPICQPQGRRCQSNRCGF